MPHGRYVGGRIIRAPYKYILNNWRIAVCSLCSFLPGSAVPVCCCIRMSEWQDIHENMKLSTWTEPVVLDNRRELIPLRNQVEINSYEKWGCLVLFWSWFLAHLRVLDGVGEGYCTSTVHAISAAGGEGGRISYNRWRIGWTPFFLGIRIESIPHQELA